jgi:hypothetical protein
MAVPYTFGSATAAIPLSQLDNNFATTITLGNTAIQLGNTVTTLNNMTLANVTISSGNVTLTNVSVTNANVTTALTLSGGTANGVAYLNTSKVVTTGSALVFDGTNLGIGTTSPSTYAKLAVRGSVTTNSVNYSGLFSDAVNSSLYIGHTATTVNLLSDTAITFATGGSPSSFTERARIDSSGNLLIGNTGTNLGVAIEPSAFGAGNGNINICHPTGANGNSFVQFVYSTASIIGNIAQNGTTGVLYNLTSDYRLKNEQQPLTGAKEFVMALQPKKWQWWDGSGEGVGFVAHEFMEVAKYSGSGEKDAVDAEGNPVYQSIQPSSSEVMANLVAHIQNLETRLAALESN